MHIKSSQHYKNQDGNALIIVMVLFVAISLSIASGLVVPVLRANRIATNTIHSVQSYALAESGSEDLLYRILQGKQYSTTETLVLAGSTATTTVSTIGATEKTVSTFSDVSNINRTVALSLVTASGIAFNYGLQAGDGGITLSGGSTINGNVYSNGNINAVSATITGTAIAANSAALTADQSNETPTTPTSSINFRNASASQDFAQSFQLSTTAPINKIQFYIKKTGSPSDATVRLVADNAGSPSTTAIAIGSALLTASQVTTSYGWVNVVFPTSPSLMPDTTYWVVVDNSTQNTNNYYTIGANTAYTRGAAKTGAYSGSWTTLTTDGYFRVYTGGLTSLIGGAGYVGGVNIGTAGLGDAWAATVAGASVSGTIYCTTGTNNNKSCNTSRPSPDPQPLPFSEANVTEWKEEAEAGGTITGNYTVGYAGATLGPKKITGNLLVNGGGTLTMTGTLWVQGTVTLTGGGKIILPANYTSNSGKIVADGTITVNGGGSAGSGTSGSYLFLVSTSKCPNTTGCTAGSAVNVSGGAGAIAVDAEYGNVALSGGAALKSVVGNSITVGGGSSVTYELGLASPSFVDGPSGSWTIASWKEE